MSQGQSTRAGQTRSPPAPGVLSSRRAAGGFARSADQACLSSTPNTRGTQQNLSPAAPVASKSSLPRLIVENNLGEEIKLQEACSSGVITLRNGVRGAIDAIEMTEGKQLCLSYPGADNQWTSPFTIPSTGTTYVKISKAGQTQRLVRANVSLGYGTILVQLNMETEKWPFAIRNRSNAELVFWQSHPDVSGEARKAIKYRLPAKSMMPYWWDHPTAKSKEITIDVFSLEWPVNLDQIGLPTLFGQISSTGQKKIIAIDFKGQDAQELIRKREILQLELIEPYNNRTSSQKAEEPQDPRAATSNEDTLVEVERTALGRSWLKEFDTPGEEYIAHIAPVDPKTVIMVTSHRILGIKTVNNNIVAAILHGPTSLMLEWQIPFSQISNITKESMGLRVRFRGEKDGEKIEDIAISSQIARDYFWRKLSVGIEGYNRKSHGTS